MLSAPNEIFFWKKNGNQEFSSSRDVTSYCWLTLKSLNLAAYPRGRGNVPGFRNSILVLLQSFDESL